MIGMLQKDFINLKKNIKIVVVLTFFYGIMAFTTTDTSFFSSMFTMLIAVMTLSVYSYDELARWDVYALTMPISREEMVRSKYIIMLLLTLLGAGSGTVLSIFIKAIQHKEHLFTDIESSWYGGAVVIFFYCIALPVITKLGVEKARFVFLAIYIIPFGMLYFGGKAVKAGAFVIPEQLIWIAEKLVQNAAMLVPLVLLFILAVSYTVSVAIYRKKEF